ncbi:hypothetical protein OAS67_06080 [Alphaproteobacteria bacterium]|nr:hypothetical protein [Alphaproteobacteria bacterium]
MTPDVAEAYLWLTLATSQNQSAAKKLPGKAEDRLDRAQVAETK